MSQVLAGELAYRVEQLERSNYRWKVMGFAALSTVVVLLGVLAYAFSTGPTLAQPAGQKQPAQEFSTDTATTSTHYANFFRISVTPEELIFDSGLNTQMAPQGADPVKLTHRTVINFYTAKRLANALQSTVQQHENTFGTIELDFQKRLKKN